MPEAIDHLDLVVGDFERSLRFYVELLRPLGYNRTSEIEGERGERVVYVGRPGGFGSVSVRAAQSGAHATPYDRYGVGIHHIAFSAPSRAVVDERAEWLRANGHEVESGPREYDYSPGYYALFLRDPDGIKLEIVHRPGDGDGGGDVDRPGDGDGGGDVDRPADGGGSGDLDQPGDGDGGGG